MFTTKYSGSRGFRSRSLVTSFLMTFALLFTPFLVTSNAAANDLSFGKGFNDIFGKKTNKLKNKNEDFIEGALENISGKANLAIAVDPTSCDVYLVSNKEIRWVAYQGTTQYYTYNDMGWAFPIGKKFRIDSYENLVNVDDDDITARTKGMSWKQWAGVTIPIEFDRVESCEDTLPDIWAGCPCVDEGGAWAMVGIDRDFRERPGSELEPFVNTNDSDGTSSLNIINDINGSRIFTAETYNTTRRVLSCQVSTLTGETVAMSFHLDDADYSERQAMVNECREGIFKAHPNSANPVYTDTYPTEPAPPSR